MDIFLAAISILTLTSGGIYYFYALNWTGIIISCGLSILLGWRTLPLFFSGKKESAEKAELSNSAKKSKGFFLIILLTAYALLSASAFIILWKNRTTNAIISPWQVIPDYFFIIYFAATLCLAFISFRLKAGFKYSRIAEKLLIIFHYFFTFSLAVIVYKIGYGFDPFIHEAALKVIDQNGLITPKTLYYSGFYGLITIVHKILFLPLGWINKLIIPLIASIVLPAISIKTFDKIGWKKYSSALTLLLLAFPFTFLIQSTPQNLAFIFVLAVILLGLAAKNHEDFLLIFLLSLAAFMIHPLAGLPAIFFSLAAWFLEWDKNRKISFGKIFGRMKNVFVFFYFLACSLVLPLAFYFIENNDKTAKLFSLANLFNILEASLKTITLSLPNKENVFLNFAYALGNSGLIVYLTLALAGLIIAYKKRLYYYRLYLYLSLALFASFILTQSQAFEYLISYERSAYAERILFLSFLFLLPFPLLAIKNYAERLAASKDFLFYSNILFVAGLITSSLYLSYPRYDAYFNSRGFSTGSYDLAAVDWIEKDAGKEKFIVLSNQQIGAAALHEFGFNHYYQSKNGQLIFNYPIPTGGQLYQYYLDMVYEKPTRATMIKAMDLVGAKTGYFVLNKYWFNSIRLLDQAKVNSDSYKFFGTKDVSVFKYKLK